MKYKSKGGVKEPTGKQKRQMRKAARMKDKRRDDSGRSGRLRKKGKPTGAILEESKEVKFGGPHRRGGVPGALKRAAKKTAKGKANVKEGLDRIQTAGTGYGNFYSKTRKKDKRQYKKGKDDKVVERQTRQGARQLKKGIRQKKRGAKIKENYEFRQAVKRGDVDAPMGPNIGNLGEGKRDKKFLGGRLAGAIKGFRGGKGQGLKARLAGAAKGAAGGGMLGRAIGAARGMKNAAGQGGGLRGMLKAGAQGAMQGAFGGGAQQNAAEAAPAEGMEEEMMYGGKLKDRRKMGGCKKGEPCEAYDGGRGPKKPKRRRKKNTGFKTRVRNIGKRKYGAGGDAGCKKGEPCDQGGGGKRMPKNKKVRQVERQAKKDERRRRRARRRGR